MGEGEGQGVGRGEEGEKGEGEEEEGVGGKGGGGGEVEDWSGEVISVDLRVRHTSVGSLVKRGSVYRTPDPVGDRSKDRLVVAKG